MSGLFGSASSTAAATSTTGDTSKDVALVTPPEDSVSDLQFSPTGDFLAVASWDKKVRIYQVGENGQSEGKFSMDFDGPVLSCSWSAVSALLPFSLGHDFILINSRMVRKWQALVQTKASESWTLLQAI